MEIKGLDEFQKQLKQLEKNAQDLEGTNNVPLGELLTDSFLAKHTKFDNFSAFESSQIFNKYESFEAIPDSEFDVFINENSNFENWDEMLSKATSEYVTRKLGF